MEIRETLIKAIIIINQMELSNKLERLDIPKE